MDNDWRCAVCETSNGGERFVCAECRRPRAQEYLNCEEEEAPGIHVRWDAPFIACGNCQTLNPSALETCRWCGWPIAVQLTVPGPPLLFEAEDESGPAPTAGPVESPRIDVAFVCEQCGVRNMLHRITCIHCGTILPAPANRESERRWARRCGLHAPACLVAGDDTQAVIVQEISRSGILFRSDRPCFVGEQLTLRLSLQRTEFEVQVFIRSERRDLDANMPFLCGGEFLDPPFQLIRSIVQSVESRHAA